MNSAVLKRHAKWPLLIAQVLPLHLVFAAAGLGAAVVWNRVFPHAAYRDLIGLILPLIVFGALCMGHGFAAWQRVKPRALRPDQLERVLSRPLVHFTRADRLKSIFQEGQPEPGQSGMAKLDPSTSDYQTGAAAFCFSGWPSRYDLMCNVGFPETVIIINPADVPPGKIQYRPLGNTIMLMDGYYGPAKWEKVGFRSYHAVVQRHSP